MAHDEPGCLKPVHPRYDKIKHYAYVPSDGG